MLVEDTGDPAAHLDRLEELGLRRVVAHGGITHRARPDRGNKRADLEALRSDHLGDAAEFVIRGGGIGVGEEKKVIDSVEFLSIDLGRGGEIEHAFEGNRRLLPVAVAFTDETGPHGIVQFERGHGREDVGLVLEMDR